MFARDEPHSKTRKATGVCERNEIFREIAHTPHPQRCGNEESHDHSTKGNVCTTLIIVSTKEPHLHHDHSTMVNMKKRSLEAPKTRCIEARCKEQSFEFSMLRFLNFWFKFNFPTTGYLLQDCHAFLLKTVDQTVKSEATRSKQ